MERLYRKVAVFERLPKNNGFYYTNLGLKKFIDGEWTCKNLKQSFPSIFYEEIPDPTVQLKADKEDLLEMLDKSNKHLSILHDLIDNIHNNYCGLKDPIGDLINNALDKISNKL